MSAPEQYPIAIRERSHRLDGRAFQHETRHGWLEVVFRPETGQYLMTNLQVTRQRRGIGKLLLQSGLEHASRIRADYIESMIISRECLHAMRSVFGPEHLAVAREGKFNHEVVTDADLASAHLYYPLNTTNTP